MKKTYPGQSTEIIIYCTRATIISIVIIGSAIFSFANARPVLPTEWIHLNTSFQQKHLSTVKILNKMEEGVLYYNSINLQTKTFFKGYDQQTAGLF